MTLTVSRILALFTSLKRKIRLLEIHLQINKAGEISHSFFKMIKDYKFNLHFTNLSISFQTGNLYRSELFVRENLRKIIV